MIKNYAYILTIVVAITSYVIQFSIIQRRKHEKMMLRHISNCVNEEEHLDNILQSLPSSMYYMILDDDGKVVDHSTNKNIIGLNLKSNVYMENSIKKIVSKAVTGGGYTKFKWGNGDHIGHHIAYSKRLNNKNTLCIIKDGLFQEQVK